MRVGKPPVGTIALNAFQKGNHVVIEVEDDGRGMDPTALARRRRVRRGARHARTRRASSSRSEMLALIFMPGFTTKDDATRLSRPRRRAWTS